MYWTDPLFRTYTYCFYEPETCVFVFNDLALRDTDSWAEGNYKSTQYAKVEDHTRDDHTWIVDR